MKNPGEIGAFIRAGYATVMALGLAGNSDAQGFLTVGEVYDFDAGDVIHHSYAQSINGLSGPPVSRIDTIRDEFWTMDLDSVRYILSRWSYQPSMFGGAPSLNNWTDTLWYTDLTTAPEHFSLALTCQVLGDTLGEDVIPFDAWSPDCAGDEWYRGVINDTCMGWDVPYWDSWFVEGCGGPYSVSYDPFTFTLQTHALSYCKKGIDECGTPLIIPLGLLDETLDPEVILVTSIFRDEAVFKVTMADGCEVVCLDGSGRVVFRELLRSGSSAIHTSALAAGSYSFVCSTTAGSVVLRGVKVF